MQETIPTTPIAPQLSSFSELLHKSIATYKAKYKQLLRILAVPIIIALVAAVVSIDGVAAQLPPVLSITLGTLFAITAIIFVPLVHISIIYSLKEGNEALTVKDLYRMGFRKLTSYWWLTFLTGVITLGGMVLFIIPGLVLQFWFGLAVYVLINEDISGMAALLKSREYVRGYWWKVFFRSLILTIIMIIPLAILSALLNDETVTDLLSYVFVAPVMLIFWNHFYTEIKAIKGPFTFEVTTKKKLPYILFAILGVIIVPITLIAIFSLMAQLSAY